MVEFFVSHWTHFAVSVLSVLCYVFTDHVQDMLHGTSKPILTKFADYLFKENWIRTGLTVVLSVAFVSILNWVHAVDMFNLFLVVYIASQVADILQ